MSARRDERGAVALMVAFLALVLFAMAALAVDLGQAWVAKRNAQADTDFAALAGGHGDNLPKTAAGSNCSVSGATWARPLAADQAMIDAADYLTKHRNQSVSFSGSNPATALTAGQLADCDFTNGEAAYGKWSRTPTGLSFTANKNQFSVVSPREQVDFSFAPVLGTNSTTVAGQATVEIKTQLQQTLPLYAFTGCDYGQQTIAQPTNGQSSSGVVLDFPTANNTWMEFTALSTDPGSTLTPPAVTYLSTTSKITITGTRLEHVKRVGFFRSNPLTAPTRIESVKPLVMPDPSWVLNAATDATTLTVPIPATVTAVQDTWFVRLYGKSGNNASAPDEWTPVTANGNPNSANNLAARPFVVGTATLSCAQGSTSGNFGTLDLFNSSSGAPSGQDDNIAYNIAYGLEYGLAPYPQANWAPPDYECYEGMDAVAKEWDTGDDNSGANCVSTQPGLPSNAAEKGLVTGIGSANKSLLKTTDGQCANDWPGAPAHMTTAPTGDTINNDVLTCFLLDTTTTVADVSSPTYPFPADVPKLDQSIYKSPRFVLVPVLGKGPTSGSSNSYQIVDFRPGFLTDQASTAMRGSGYSGDNGLVWTANHKLQAVKVIFLNPHALPDPPLDPNGLFIPYVGSGKKHLLLVD